MIKLSWDELDTIVVALEERASGAWLQANYPRRAKHCTDLIEKLGGLRPAEGPWVVLPQAAHADLYSGAVQGDMKTAALRVLVLDERIAAWLEANDPKALAQARRALGI